MTTLSGARVLVTGAGGFVGRHLVAALAARGARVHGAGLGPRPVGLALEGWRDADLAELALARDAVAEARADAVVHLAAQSSAARSFEAPGETFRANVSGTWSLLEAVRVESPAARVLVVSSSEVYGPIAPGTRASEATPFAPTSPYALSKAAAEEVAHAYGAAHGLDVVRARAFGHTGPGQDTRFVVPSFAKQLADIEAGRAEPVLRVGNLDVTRDLSDVRDIVEGYIVLLERGARGGVYNLCRGEGANLRDLVAELVRMARVQVSVEVDPTRLRPADMPWLVGDPSAIARDTGWAVRLPLAATLGDVLEEWRARAKGV